ncbi:MAG TPA: type II CAAX endopeptidase family protein [Ktedonobacterales bacterium]
MREASQEVAHEQRQPSSAEMARVAPWSVRQSAAGVLLTLVPWLIFSLGSAALASPTSSTSGARVPLARDIAMGVAIFLVSALLEAIFLIAPLYIAARASGRGMSWRERLAALGLRRGRPGVTLGIVVGGVIVAFAASALYSWIVTALRLPLQTNSDQVLALGRTEPFTALGLLAAAALVAPICEEIFFRGFAFAGLLNGLSVGAAAILSAGLFAVAHTDLGSLIPLFLIGLVLAWARWRADSLWPAILIHMAYNTLAAVTIIPLLFK